MHPVFQTVPLPSYQDILPDAGRYQYSELHYYAQYYHIAPSILIISGNHFREIVLSWERRKTGLRHSLYYILYVVP